ncbi:MAG: TMEM165/GDT1 family protein [Deferrisomatales bacterium]|nr:TMEM165/GDT1 family protein [Deferrisomatales bacterium]
MEWTVFLSVFGLIFVAELGDKTQLAAMALATRYPWRPVLLGIAAAFVALNLAAVVVGKVLFLVLPLSWIQLASAGLFLFFGVATLRAANSDTEETAGERSRNPLLGSFLLILLAELGDKTQLATASLAAQYDAPVAVFAGSTLALWSVSLLAVLVGARLTRYVPMAVVHRVAGVLFLGFAGLALYQAMT